VGMIRCNWTGLRRTALRQRQDRDRHIASGRSLDKPDREHRDRTERTPNRQVAPPQDWRQIHSHSAAANACDRVDRDLRERYAPSPTPCTDRPMAAGPRGLHPRLRPKPPPRRPAASGSISYRLNHPTLTAVVNRATQGGPARDAEATRVRPTNRPDRYVSPAAAPLRAPERFGLISKSVAGRAL
jgi:hypothetical protein